MSPHYLDEKKAFVRVRSVADFVDGIDGRIDGGVEAECEIGAEQIVVDGTRNADELAAPDFRQIHSAAKRAVAADEHERVHAELLQIVRGFLLPFQCKERGSPRCLQDGAAALDNVRDGAGLHLDEFLMEDSLVTTLEAQHANAVSERDAGDRANGGVHSGCVTTAGYQAKSFHVSVVFNVNEAQRAPPPRRFSSRSVCPSCCGRRRNSATFLPMRCADEKTELGQPSCAA